MSKPIIQVAAGIIRNEFGQLYLTQRLEGQDFAQALEFPGGKVDAGETPEEALKRPVPAAPATGPAVSGRAAFSVS